MTINSISEQDRELESTGQAERSPEAVVDDRLSELLPADALEDALKGLGPEEITGPGGLLNRLTGLTHIQGPDFPTAGIIMGRSGIRDAYETGRGKIKVRAKAHIEEIHQASQPRGRSSSP